MSYARDSDLGFSNEGSSPPPGRFTEEWDASRRGSSIVEDHRSLGAGNRASTAASYNQSSELRPDQIRKNTGSMQRSTSVHSYNAGDDLALPVKESSNLASSSNGNAQQLEQKLPSRGNTLKKKGSMRKGGSVRRSSSRRSMRAGSVRSLALHSGSDPDEAHSVFYCPIPTNANPTDVLANRFQCTYLCLFEPRISQDDSMFCNFCALCS